MGTAVALDDEEDEEAEHASAQGVHCSLSRLCDWYNSKTKVGLRSSADVKYLHREKVCSFPTVHPPHPHP